MKHFFKISEILFYFAILATVTFTACSDRDDEQHILTTTLNMMNEDNGATRLGNSDVYINNSNNFASNACRLFDMGSCTDIEKIDTRKMDIKYAVSEIAVQLDHGYAIYAGDTHHFPSGTIAIPVNSDIYGVCPKSWINSESTTRTTTTVGATVNFGIIKPYSYNLPDWNSTVGTIESGSIAESEEKPIVVKLSSSDLEVENAEAFNDVNVKTESNRIIITRNSYYSSDETISLLIRCENVYTKINVILKASSIY